MDFGMRNWRGVFRLTESNRGLGKRLRSSSRGWWSQRDNGDDLPNDNEGRYN